MDAAPPFTGLGYTCRVEHPGLIILAAVGEAPKQAAACALALAVEQWLNAPIVAGAGFGTSDNRQSWQVEQAGICGADVAGEFEVVVHCAPPITDRLRVALSRAGLGRAATEAYKAALAEVEP